MAKNKKKKSEDAGELLTHLVVRKLWPRLEDKSDVKALRKALILLILATQDNANPGVTELIQGLLTQFHPLLKAFEKGWAQFSKEAGIGIARDHEKILLVIEKAFVDALLKEIHGKEE